MTDLPSFPPATEQPTPAQAQQVQTAQPQPLPTHQVLPQHQPQPQPQPHTPFPTAFARLPDLLPAHKPTTPSTLLQFLTDPASPWFQVTRTGSGFAYEDVVRGWLVPVLVGVFRGVDEVAQGQGQEQGQGQGLDVSGGLGGLMKYLLGRGGRGSGLVGLWTVKRQRTARNLGHTYAAKTLSFGQAARAHLKSDGLTRNEENLVPAIRAKYLSPLPSSGASTATPTTATPSLSPAEVLQIIHRIAQDVTEEELAVGGAVDAKLREFVTRVMEFGKQHAVVDRLLPVFQVLLLKYRPSPGVLTSLHVVFLEACLLTRNLIAGKALADISITDVTSSPLTYMDYLGYHYLAGMIYIGCREWEQAREMLLAAISMPGSSVSAVQIAAHKKLVLVDLIISGEVKNYGKIVSGPLTAAFALHGRAYTELGNAYRDLDYGKLKRVLEKDVKFYQQDQNYGLLMSVYESIPARRLINLTETYVRMDMHKLAEKISKGSFTEMNPQEAEELVVKLVKAGRLHARITHPEGKPSEVSFIEDPELFNTPATIDRIGVEMNSIRQMEGMLKGLEQAWSMHEGWLKEALRKEKDKSKAFDAPGGPPGRGGQDAGIRAAVEAAGLSGGNVRGVGANWADAGF